MGDVPRVVAPREADDAVPRLSPDPANTPRARLRRLEIGTALPENLQGQPGETVPSVPRDLLPRRCCK